MNIARSTHILSLLLLILSSCTILRVSAVLTVPRYNATLPSAQYYFKGKHNFLYFPDASHVARTIFFCKHFRH